MFSAVALLAGSLVLGPSSAWHVQQSDAICTLSRNYGDGPTKLSATFLSLFRSPGSEVFIQTSDTSSGRYSGEAFIVRASDGHHFFGTYSSVPTVSDKRVTWISIPQSIYDTFDQGETLQIAAGTVKATIAISNFAKASQAISTCESQLLKVWHFDTDLATIAVPPKPKLEWSAYFNTSSYPPDADFRGYSGRVLILVRVSKDGTVDDCRLIVGANKSLDDATCATARTVSFFPARDLNGNPAPFVFALTVHWVH